MRQHELQHWRCATKSHGVLLFKDQGEYEEHIRRKHKNMESQLSILVERNSISSRPIFESCPLCGKLNIDTCIEDHIAIHLRYLALKSLPFNDDEGDDHDEDSNGFAIITEEIDQHSQGTIVDDPDYGSPLDFDDTDPIEGDEAPPNINIQSWGENDHADENYGRDLGENEIIESGNTYQFHLRSQQHEERIEERLDTTERKKIHRGPETGLIRMWICHECTEVWIEDYTTECFNCGHKNCTNCRLCI